MPRTPVPSIDPDLLAREFPQQDDICYLNHAAVAPWPLRTAEAVRAFAGENIRRGAAGYERWLQTERTLRAQLREICGAAHSDEIALVKNTSEALSFVAHGLDWNAGDNVVITDLEFPSNRIVWESLRPRGVEVREAPVSHAADPEAAVEAAIDGATRLVAVSSVQFGTGLKLDIGRLGASCRARGVLFCLDAIQSIGALRFDVQAAQADFAMADGHKWMLGPEGLGLFYCREAVMDRLQLHEYGWHMIERQGDYDRREWETARSARRFECGSSNMLGAHALSASVGLLLELGMETVETRLAERVEVLLAELDAVPGVRVVSPRDPARRAGIVTFALANRDPEPVYRDLRERGVICALRGGGIRFSPHFYTPDAILERAVATLRALL